MTSTVRAHFKTKILELPALAIGVLLCFARLAPASAQAQTPSAQIRSQAAPSASALPGPSSQGSATLELPLNPEQNGATHESSLELPSFWNPTERAPLGTPPPAIADVTIPDPFIGCWKGAPPDWDETHVFRGFVIGSPGEIEFCYSKKRIDVPEAQVSVTGMRRALEVALNFGLAYSTFAAHSIRTDVFGVSPDKIHGETTLTIEHKYHLLHLVPVDAPAQRSLVEWSGAVAGPDELVMHARQVLYWHDVPLFAGAWHCEFHRVAASGGAN
jgi:hypothetical protein